MPKNLLLSDFPPHLDIEATSRCNFNCSFCDKQPLLQKNQLGDIKMTLFKKIIDEGALFGLKSVQLSYRGEPLLHPDLAEMVHYAKKKGVHGVYFCTNGMLLTPLMAQKLISAGLDCITISVQGSDSAAFEETRLGAKYSVILRNIKNLMETKMKYSLKSPYVKVQAVVLPDYDLEEYRKFWEPHCDEVINVPFRDCLNRRKGIRTVWICEQPWQRLTIEWDGTILPCNNDDIREFSPGNARTMTIYEAWHHDKLKILRQLHLQGNSHEAVDCDGCTYRTLGFLETSVPLKIKGWRGFD
jgi:radical SAM protein with 4Fe4S-binding SPASM domain